MKFVFNHEKLVEINSAVQAIAEADSATVLQLGAMDMGEKVLCIFRTTTQAEEIVNRIIIDKPEGFDGSAITKAVKSKIFGGLVSSLAAFKEDIFIDIDGDEVKLGNSTTVVPVGVLSAIPQEMNAGSQDAPLMSMNVKGKDLQAFIRRALECTDPADTSYGFANAIVCVDANTGKVRGLSTDSHVISYASMNVQVANESCISADLSEEIRAKMVESLNQMKANLEAHCKETEQDISAVYLLFPTGAVQHLKKLTSGKEVVQIGVDKRRVYVSYDNNAATYTFVQGRDRKVDFSFVERALAEQSSASAQLDAAQLLRSVDFVNGTSKLTCTSSELTPLKIAFDKGQLILSGGKDFSIRNIVKANAINGEGTDVLVSGDWVKARIEALDKGGACVSVIGNMIVLSNGTLDKTSEYKMFVGLIDPEKWKQEVEESEENADAESKTTDSEDAA